MKKIVSVLLAIALLLGAAYAAGAWYLGGKIETAIAEPQKLFESMPYIKILKREFHRGLFTSEETVTYELFGDLFRMVERMQKERPGASRPNAPPAVAPRPLVLIAVSRIRHGPLLDGRTTQAAVIDTEIDVEDRFKPALTRVLGDRKPVTVHTLIDFDGNGESLVSSPAFQYVAPAAEGVKPDEISWGGVSATIHFTPGFAEQRIKADAPEFEVTSPANGAHALVTGLHFESDSKRVFDDEPLLAAGKANATIAELVVDGVGPTGKSFRVRTLGYQTSIDAVGEFVDLAGKLGAAEVAIGDVSYGPAHYDFSLRHAHARAFAQIIRAMLKINADPEAASAKDPTVALKSLSGPFMKLLEFNPELSIDRFGFMLPDGGVELKARAKLNDAKAEDFRQPQMLLAKLEASADISLPASVLVSQFGSKASSPEALAAEQRSRHRQLATLIEHDYLQQDGALVRTKLEFANGQLKVNGQPFDPAMLQPPSETPGRVAAPKPAGRRELQR